MSGASPASSQGVRRTVFLPDLPVRSIASAGYLSRRLLLGGVPVSRYVNTLLLVLAAVWASGLMPVRWAGAAGFLSLFAAFVVAGQVLKRRDYVSFRSTSAPQVPPAAVPPGQSLPVYVTGELSVEGKSQRFTCLPGFYKTFATREHALLCLVRPRKKWGLLRWPEDEVGMWYAFIEPETIEGIRWGTMTFARDPMPAISLERERCEESRGRLGRGKTEVCTVETLVVSSKDETVLRKILADLIADDPAQHALVPETRGV